jgi:hypothetical protein
MQRNVMWLFLAATILVPALVGAAVTEADFEVKTTQNLLNLCTVSPNDPRYREALHFCHGYLVGAYHYHLAETDGEGGKLLVCPPTPPPSRNETFQMFIAWVQAHPQYLNERPVETEFRFLTEKWPCQK